MHALRRTAGSGVFNMYIRAHKQRGVTLIELMVGLTVGLLVLAGVLTIYLSTLKTSNATIKSSRLNQEMGAILNIMASDIRRAGYNGAANPTQPSSNPFNLVDTATPANTTALRVHATTDNGATYTDKTGELALTDRIGSCILYAYDADSDGTVDDNEKYGFRWDRQAGDPLMMRTGTAAAPNNCKTNGWEPVTDASSVVITALTFDMRDSKCLNTAEPDGADRNADGTVDEMDERNCYLAAYPVALGADPPETTLETRNVRITLRAQLADDPSVTGLMSQTVQVRNHLVRVW